MPFDETADKESVIFSSAQVQGIVQNVVQSVAQQVLQTVVAGVQQEIKTVSNVLRDLAVTVGEQTAEIRQLREMQAHTADQGERLTAVETRLTVMEQQAEKYTNHFRWTVGVVITLALGIAAMLVPHLHFGK